MDRCKNARVVETAATLKRLYMRPLFLIALAACVAAGSSPAWSQTDTKTQVAPPTVGDVKKVAVKDPDEIVCIHQTSIESRIPGKPECHTRRDWDAMSDAAHRTTQDMQQRGATTTTMRGG